MKFKLIGSAIAALLATSFAADAADMPRPVYKGVRSVISYYNWTGFYAGINAGYGFGTSDWEIPAVSTEPKGFIVGGTLGYNYQTGSFVWGLEGDLAWSDVKATVDCGLGFTCETANRWLGTARGRLGYAFDRWLPYITGGAAFGSVRATLNPAAVAATTETRVGWTAGGGLEYAFMGNWTAKIEYLYVDLGSFDPGFTAPVTNSVSFKEHVVRGGLNYKFSGPVFTRW
ncbi:MAG TPA: outer membrane protein [Reyranella sp.]|nr:outer membrane protein [Reyranella sp.]